MINQTNKDRGSVLFLQKINTYKIDLTIPQQKAIDKLAAYYNNHVAVMASDTTFAAAGMAAACDILVKRDNISTLTDASLIESALQTYKDSRPKSTTVAATAEIQNKPTANVNFGRVVHGYQDETPESLALKLATDAEIASNTVEYKTEEPHYWSFPGHEKEQSFTDNASSDVIDLVGDFNASDLSIEGLRARKMLRSDFDTMSGAIPSVEVKKEIKGKVWRGTDGRIDKAECPYCHESDVYMLAMDTCCCFGCDKEFKVPLDDDDTGEDEIESDIIIVRG